MWSAPKPVVWSWRGHHETPGAASTQRRRCHRLGIQAFDGLRAGRGQGIQIPPARLHLAFRRCHTRPGADMWSVRPCTSRCRGRRRPRAQDLMRPTQTSSSPPTGKPVTTRPRHMESSGRLTAVLTRKGELPDLCLTGAGSRCSPAARGADGLRPRRAGLQAEIQMRLRESRAAAKRVRPARGLDARAAAAVDHHDSAQLFKRRCRGTTRS